MHTNKEWLTQKYHGEQLSLREIARLANRDDTTILYWMDKFRINRRSIKEGTGLFFQQHPEKIRYRERTGRWKGGTYKDCYGYVWVSVPGHPKSSKKGYVKRCNLIAEEVLLRYMKPKEMVHHVNGIKDDDRNENLLICTESYHGWLNSQMKPRNSTGQFCKVLEAKDGDKSQV